MVKKNNRHSLNHHRPAGFGYAVHSRLMDSFHWFGITWTSIGILG